VRCPSPSAGAPRGVDRHGRTEGTSRILTHQDRARGESVEQCQSRIVHDRIDDNETVETEGRQLRSRLHAGEHEERATLVQCSLARRDRDATVVVEAKQVLE
jgi:hypothetical protein